MEEFVKRILDLVKRDLLDKDYAINQILGYATAFQDLKLITAEEKQDYLEEVFKEILD